MSYWWCLVGAIVCTSIAFIENFIAWETEEEQSEAQSSSPKKRREVIINKIVSYFFGILCLLFAMIFIGGLTQSMCFDNSASTKEVELKQKYSYQIDTTKDYSVCRYDVSGGRVSMDFTSTNNERVSVDVYDYMCKFIPSDDYKIEKVRVKTETPLKFDPVRWFTKKNFFFIKHTATEIRIYLPEDSVQKQIKITN